MLSSDDPEFGGFKNLFEDFYEEVRIKLEQIIKDRNNPALIEDYIVRISDYVMCKLHSTIWSKDRKKHPLDKDYSDRVQMLKWITPSHIELPKKEKTVNYPMWKVSAQILQRMESVRSL